MFCANVLRHETQYLGKTFPCVVVHLHSQIETRVTTAQLSHVSGTELTLAQINQKPCWTRDETLKEHFIAWGDFITTALWAMNPTVIVDS